MLFLENTFLVLRSGGSLILTTPYHGYLKNLALSLFNKWDKHFTVERRGGHIKFFSEETLARMLSSCGFENVFLTPAAYVGYGNLWSAGLKGLRSNRR